MVTERRQANNVQNTDRIHRSNRRKAHQGELMRWRLVIIAMLALTCLTVAKAEAEPLVTISCDKPEGFSIQYGVSFPESLEASKKNQAEPPPSLKGPTKDGILGTPTFVIDSNREKMTVTWAELPEDVEARKQAKERNLPTIPPSATNATVVLFFKEQISAIDAEPWAITTYSFFPRIGTAFIGEQALRPGSKNSM
jgi:hypothetical protein